MDKKLARQPARSKASSEIELVELIDLAEAVIELAREDADPSAIRCLKAMRKAWMRRPPIRRKQALLRQSLEEALEIAARAARAGTPLGDVAAEALRNYLQVPRHLLDDQSTVSTARKKALHVAFERAIPTWVSRRRGAGSKWDAINDLAKNFGLACATGADWKSESRKRRRASSAR